MQVVFDGFRADFLEGDAEEAVDDSSEFTACGFTWCASLCLPESTARTLRLKV